MVIDNPPESSPRSAAHVQRSPSPGILDHLSQRHTTKAQDGTPSGSRTPPRQASRQPSGLLSQQRLSVVVSASPNRAGYHTPAVTYGEDDSEPTARKQSNLSPQLKKGMQIEAAGEQTRAGRQASSAARQLINTQYDRKKAFGVKETALPPRQPSAPASGTSIPIAPPRQGRPKGWKPGMSYAQMRGNPLPTRPRSTTAATTGVVKRRGRPPKAPPLPPDEIFRTLQPKWLSFLCEWKDCKADLQNLRTLRRHVKAVHLEEQDYEEEGKEEEPWTCLWGNCGLAAQAPTFETFEEMETHVEEQHLVPFGWHLGEGPKNEILERQPEKTGGKSDAEDAVPSYLNDKYGKLVTPSIKDQRMEDHAGFKERRKMLWHLMKEFNEGSDSEDEPERPEPADEELMVA